ncbi:prepilin-type N-terminal cleavage/methylation domain-containing protein [Faecalibacillus faecis]|uniref:prepilin-type N-terminal cleavage/methylation domain-containing protein n=1 Tax=Faecalibacillus faecis TaxID=1982628 RepID=UPI002F93BFCE
MNKLKEKQNKKGFTLVEIIVVLVILAILAAIAIPSVLGYVEDARKTQYIAEARSIYLMMQTEEAKYMAKNNYNSLSEFEYDVFLRDEDLIYNNTNKTNGKIYEYTGLKNAIIMHYVEDTWSISWESTNNHTIVATISKNKKITIDHIF